MERILNHGIITEKADNALRKLKPGFGWQTYRVYAIRTVNSDEFKTIFSDSKKDMIEAEEKWEEVMVGFINQRAATLGLHVAGIKGQLLEQPNEAKEIEVEIWEQKDLMFAWSIWAYLKGPLLLGAITETPKPLYMFWPADSFKWNAGVPEVLDATKLSLIHEVF